MAQRITKFSIGQSAKFCGVLYALFGLIFVPFFLLMEMFAPEGTGGFGTLFAVGMPVMYAVIVTESDLDGTGGR